MANRSVLTRLKDFQRELRRRKVYQVGAVYVVVGFAVAQGAQYLFEMAGLPVMASRAVAIVLLLGLPVALVLAWAHELRPEETPTAGESSPGRSAARRDEAHLSDRGISIVVLPFDNISPDPSDAYFADGLTEEITASLSAVRHLRVTSRTSAAVIKRSGRDTRAIGSELRVSHVLEGSVRKAGDALRVTAQLIRTDTDEHVWSERYDGALEDVFGMQEAVARSIVRTLELRLEPEEERRLAARPIDDLGAYESYLKAREASLKWTPDALEYALDQLERARARAGENPVILAGIGYVYSQFSNMGAADRDYVSLAERHARRALDVDPDNPEAHMVLGFLYQEGLGDVDRSVYHLERSLAVKPDDPHSLTWSVIALSLAGRNEEMTAAAVRLVEVDPLNPMSRAVRGYARQVTGDLQGGLDDMEASYRASPEGSAWSFFYAHALATVGRRDDALSILRREFAPDVDDIARASPAFLQEMAHLLLAVLEDDPERMAAVMTERLRTKLARDLQLSFYVMGLYALAGLREETLGWLRHMVEGGFKNYSWLAQHDPWLSRYGDDPEFNALFEQVRGAWKGSGSDQAVEPRGGPG